MNPGIKSQNPSSPWLEQWGDKAAGLLFAGITLVALFIFRDYGYSCDEVSQNRWYGQAVLRFFATFGRDLSATQEYNLYLYGGTFDVFAELLVKGLSFLEPRNARHLANVLAGLFCVAGTWKTARHLAGPTAGFWAMLFLVACAPFYGHMFMNAKDIPFASGYIWSLYWLLRVAAQFPQPPLADRLWLGLALGFSLGVRIGGVLLICYYLLLVLIDSTVEFRRSRTMAGTLARGRTILWASLPTLGMAYGLMLAFWPAALLHPLAIPVKAFEVASHFTYFQEKVFWSGRYVLSNDLPWNYLPVLFAVELPEILVVLIPAMIGGLVLKSIAGRRFAPLLFISGFSALFPLAWAIGTQAIMYDNARHFLFVLPPLCLVTAIGFQRFSAVIWQKSRVSYLVLIVIVTGSLLYSSVQMATLHPYEYAYKNIFAGGFPDSERRFDTDYWYTSYLEAASRVKEHAQHLAAAVGIPFERATFIVGVVGNQTVLEEFFPRQFKVEVVDMLRQPLKHPDYLIATTRWGGDQFYPDYPLLDTVGRRGMTFTVIKTTPEIAKFGIPVSATADDN